METVYLTALGVISASFGVYLGSRSKKEQPFPEASPDLSKNDVDTQDIADGDLSSITAGLFEPCKLVCNLHSLSDLLEADYDYVTRPWLYGQMSK